MNHGLMPRLSRATDPYMPLLLSIVVTLIASIVGIVQDSDPLWSLAVGKWIAVNQAIPISDPFSWSIYGAPWITHEWLFCWLMYQADHYLGYYGIMLIVFTAAFVYIFFTWKLCQGLNPTPYGKMAALTMALLSMAFLTARAYPFSYAFLAITMYILRMKRESRWLYLLPVVFVLWGNMHSTVVFGVGVVVVEAVASSLRYKDHRLWPLVLLVFLATLLNPYGIGIWTYFVTHFARPENKNIIEWKALDFNNIKIFIVYVTIGVGAAVLHIRALLRQIEQDRDLFMLAFWFWSSFLLSLTTFRLFPYSVFFCALFFAAYLRKVVTREVKDTLFIVVILCIITIPVASFKIAKMDKTLARSDTWPVEAATYLKIHPEIQDGIFNDYNYGGYMIYEGLKPFIDARADLYIDSGLFGPYSQAITIGSSPESVFSRYGVKSVFIPKHSPLAIYLEGRPGWDKVFEDKLSVIYKKV